MPHNQTETVDLEYGIQLTKSFANFRSDIDEDVDLYLRRLEPTFEKNIKAATMGTYPQDEVPARTFYTGMIRPFLLKGTLHTGTKEKTFVPDQAYVDDFAAGLTQGQFTSQMYVRLLQSRPGMKQEDARISFGALEFLRTCVVRVKVAEALGLQYAVNIVDETGAFDPGEPLGFTSRAIEESHLAMQYFIDSCKTPEGRLRITPFAHQASLYRADTPISEELSRHYNDRLTSNIDRTMLHISEGHLSLQAVRAVMLHRLRHGHDFINVSGNRDITYLDAFSSSAVLETVALSESFNTALQMRPPVKEFIDAQGMQDMFPEFFDPTLHHWGITKKEDRLSIQPNFRSYKGQSVTPGYGIPVYDARSHDFLGLTNYAVHKQPRYGVVLGINGLPAALTE